jgi:indolepyruvate ferredoxin oxidoreductase beta subunit
VRRLVAYQGPAYARLYLDRLAPFVAADEANGANGKLLKEVARHLAVRMSYEDVVRVAQAKIAPERMRRIARDELRVKDEPYSVHDFLKPGIEDLCQLLPPFLARPIMNYSERKGWLGRVYFGMEINSTSVSGYLRFLFLAKLRRLRPYGHRYAQEQEQIEAWLKLIAEAAQRSPELALEIAECARLIKGYGDTHARGLGNYRVIDGRIVRPALAGHIPLARAADAIASARTAALVDPEGESLARCLAEIEGQAEFKQAAE